MRINFTAEKINFTVADETGAPLIRFAGDSVDYSVDVAGLLDAVPALGDKIAELATQFDGK